MKTRRLVAFSVLLLALIIGGVGIIQAQDDCGDGLPCGKIPWDLPVLPAVSSPTPIPTTTPRPDINGLPGPGTPTGTPIGADLGSIGLADQIATAAAYAPTPMNVLDSNGDVLVFGDQINLIQQDAVIVVGYARGLSSMNFGKMTPLVAFIAGTFVIIMFVKAWTLLMPVFATLIGMFRKIVSFIMEFIPF